MSKLECTCRHVISDSSPSQTEGMILCEEDEGAFEVASAQIASFLDGVVKGRRAEWIRSHFSEPYPANASNEEVISDLISAALHPVWLSVAECSQCGRLWVQCSPGENRYVSFAPDELGYHSLLGGRKSSEQP